MQVESLKKYFQKQLSDISRPGVVSSFVGLRPSNDAVFESKPGDKRLFYYLRHQEGFSVESVWLNDLEKFSERVKRAEYPADWQNVPTLYL